MADSAGDPGGPARSPDSEQGLILISVHNVGLAVPAELISSVSEVDTATPLPGAPPHLRGLVAVGDRVLPLVDLATLLAIAPGGARVDPLFCRALFVSTGDFEAGLVCHRARGLIAVSRSALEEPKVLQGERLRPFLTAELEANGRRVGVLDVPAVLEAAAIP